MEEANKNFVYVPDQKRFVHVSELTKKEHAAALKAQFEALREQMKRDNTRAGKKEKKLGVLQGGYQNRSKALKEEIMDSHDKMVQGQMELECFERLRVSELRAMPARLETLKTEVVELRQREQDLQLRYANLVTEKENLLSSLP